MKLLLDLPIAQLLQSRPPAKPALPKSFAIDLVAAQDLVAAFAWLDRASIKPLEDTKPAEKPDDAAAPAAVPVAAAPAPHAPAPEAPKQPVATVSVREPAPLPDNPNPSHVHLVLDEGAQRIVVTVAVRGNDVNVGFRAGDDQVIAALARNAASLDHAMRAQGLDLDTFSADRDRDHERPDDEEEPA